MGIRRYLTVEGSCLLQILLLTSDLKYNVALPVEYRKPENSHTFVFKDGRNLCLISQPSSTEYSSL